MKLSPAVRNLCIAALTSLSLGGCYYGDINGASYASADCSSRYGDGYWTNDPYAYDDGYGYDCYDAADYQSGFIQIGFGGGWHQQLYYPGHGLFLFDRYGRRHSMNHDYLSYWGGRRAWWQHHGRRGHHGDHFQGRDGHHEGPRPGRGFGRGDRGNAVPPPPPIGGGAGSDGWTGHDGIDRPRDRPRGEGRGDRPRRGGGWAPPAADGGAPVTGTPRVPRYNLPARVSDDNSAIIAPAPAPRAAPEARAAPPQPRAAPEPSYSPPPSRAAPTMREMGDGQIKED